MYLERDYIMRSIHNMIRAIFKFVFRIDLTEGQPIELDDSERMEQLARLMEQVRRGQAQAAEALLYTQLNAENRQDLGWALAFYDALNELDDDALQKCGFSRDQIRQGIARAMALFGASGVMALFDGEPF